MLTRLLQQTETRITHLHLLRNALIRHKTILAPLSIPGAHWQLSDNKLSTAQPAISIFAPPDTFPILFDQFRALGAEPCSKAPLYLQLQTPPLLLILKRSKSPFPAGLPARGLLPDPPFLPLTSPNFP